MHISWRPVFIFILSCHVSALSLVECSFLKEVSQSGSNKSSNHKINKIISQKTSDIALHGLLLWASVGFSMPLGILAIRMSSRGENASTRNRVFFYLHVAFQMLSVLLATIGAAMSLKNFENSFDNNHQRLGLALYGAILVQALIGFFRPHRQKKERTYWYFVHWILGTIISFVGIINIYTGLKAYYKRTLKSTRLWTILFTAQVSCITLIYLLQDKMEYIKKQRVIPGTESTVPSDQDIPHLQNQNELLPVACGKKNALSNLFD
ncbi:cytochrome b561 domain-containing protein At4g18260-like isoform X2 [Prosopis cineraria]|uniref:cytochrome b561 domain-containing protein At4g18260-like isoform X2 n=1 Tax=Prosopis cineraria TaxID=364024 RepID=UPI00240EAD84|nr:cytochrome b561 domain-containing protein At4g18260-like isoform X2 [Prosopis cineraria]